MDGSLADNGHLMAPADLETIEVEEYQPLGSIPQAIATLLTRAPDLMEDVRPRPALSSVAVSAGFLLTTIYPGSLKSPTDGSLADSGHLMAPADLETVEVEECWPLALIPLAIATQLVILGSAARCQTLFLTQGYPVGAACPCTRAVPLLIPGAVEDPLGSVEVVVPESEEVASSLIQDVAPY